MTPETFVSVLDEWSARGGAFPRTIPHKHSLTTAGEAEAVCRALGTNHIYAVNSIKSPALFDLTAFFQDAETTEAADFFEANGLPLLRHIMREALDRASQGDPPDYGEHQRAQAHLSVLKVLSAYRRRGDGALIVRAACDPTMADGFLWPDIFGIVRDNHPDADDVFEGLRTTLPDKLAGVAYLDWANALARQQPTLRHPFDSDAGIARLTALLSDRDPWNYGGAISAASAIPFVNAAAREALIASAEGHPDARVRMEAAWALAKVGVEAGRQRLAQLCLDPRFAEIAEVYLKELGLGAYIPSQPRDPDFQAAMEMSHWLAHPMEYDHPPDEMTLYDTRELYWPPSGERCRLWLFKYRYQPRPGGDADAYKGIGLVGPITFGLSGKTIDLSPEDAYGLYCSEFMDMRGDPRADEKRSAAIGRRILAETNPDFAEA